MLGVVGPVIYTVWRRGRSLRHLAIGGHRLCEARALGLVLAGIQFAMTLRGYDLPGPVDWVPLLVMSLVVGAFESAFFHGFIQGRLEASFGTGIATAVAALQYALPLRPRPGRRGDGVPVRPRCRLPGRPQPVVLWPLLAPLGAFFNNLVKLPWASMAGLADVAGSCRCRPARSSPRARRARAIAIDFK